MKKILNIQFLQPHQRKPTSHPLQNLSKHQFLHNTRTPKKILDNDCPDTTQLIYPRINSIALYNEAPRPSNNLSTPSPTPHIELQIRIVNNTPLAIYSDDDYDKNKRPAIHARNAETIARACVRPGPIFFFFPSYDLRAPLINRTHIYTRGHAS